jgi:hypothetical protein
MTVQGWFSRCRTAQADPALAFSNVITGLVPVMTLEKRRAPQHRDGRA